jgi:Domain of unknown function (DUF5666)
MRMRLLALPLAAAFVLGPVAVAAPAHAATAAPSYSAGAVTKTTGKTTKAKAKAKVKAKAKKVVPFEATGRVESVDPATNTFKVAVKSGSKDLRGKTVLIKVGPVTKIKVKGKAATLADLKPGARVTVSGKRTPEGPLALTVIAKS